MKRSDTIRGARAAGLPFWAARPKHPLRVPANGRLQRQHTQDSASATPCLRTEREDVSDSTSRTTVGRAAQRSRPAARAPRSIALELTSCLAGLILLFISLSNSKAAEADTFSSVVSYQYQESLSQPETETTITSPVISYQYYDWIGNENLTFQNSPSVSYYFGGAPQILVQPISKNLPVGNSLTLSVNATGTAPLYYQWKFLGMDLPGATAASYSLVNAQSTNSGSYSVTVRNNIGQITSQNADVAVYRQPQTPQPEPLLFSVVESRPDLSFLAPLINTQGLRIFNPSTNLFEPIQASLRRDMMAIVLTHGLASNSGTANDVTWPLAMARTLATSRAPDGKLYSEKAHILAWDWRTNANEGLLRVAKAADRTPSEGHQLGKALLQMFGANYNQKIHFIGHSLGTLVNCAAADFIHNSRRPEADRLLPVYSYANTQVTLLDEAEVESVLSPVWMEYLQAHLDTGSSDADKARSLHTKVIPTRAAYVDSYSGLVGAAHPNVANAFLWLRLLNALETLVELPVYSSNFLQSINPVDIHGYAYEWYRESIKHPTANPYMGHRFSFERDTIGPISQRSTYYIQSNPRSPLALSPVSNLDSGVPIVLYPLYTIYKNLSQSSGKVVQGLYLGAQTTGSLVSNFVPTYTAPPKAPTYSIDPNGNPLQILPPGTTPTLDAEWMLNFTSWAGVTQPQNRSAGGKTLSVQKISAAPSNSVCTILPIQVPKEALSVSFEYQVSGAGADEFISMAVGDEEQYTMETQYLDEAGWNRSPAIHVADLSGSDVEFIFAISGTSSQPTGVLSVRNIQFYIPPRPELTLAITDASLKVSWPISAAGWTLESTSDIQGNWQVIPDAPDISNLEQSFTFDLSTGNKAFFRLRK